MDFVSPDAHHTPKETSLPGWLPNLLVPAAFITRVLMTSQHVKINRLACYYDLGIGLAGISSLLKKHLYILCKVIILKPHVYYKYIILANGSLPINIQFKKKTQYQATNLMKVFCQI